MTKKITSAILALAMLLMTACGADSMNDTSKTENSSAADTTTTTVVTESNKDWTPSLIASAPADTSKKEEKNTTKTEDKNSKTDNKEGATTTTKSASNDNDSKQKQPQEQQKPQSTQAQPRTTQGIPKTPVKPVQTTKATTKATQKQAQAQVSAPSNLSAYQKALYNMTLGKTTQKDIETVRNEFLSYGKSLYPKVPICTKLHPLITKDGRYTDSFDEAIGGTNSSTEWYMPTRFGSYNGLGTVGYKSEADRWADIEWFDQHFKNTIKATLDDNARFGDIPTVWYISCGKESIESGYSLTWVCMTAFPEEWK